HPTRARRRAARAAELPPILAVGRASQRRAGDRRRRAPDAPRGRVERWPRGGANPPRPRRRALGGRGVYRPGARLTRPRSPGRSRAPADLLHLGVLLHAPATSFPADTALLEAAERAIEHVDAIVDPHHARTQPLGQLDGAHGVARVNGPSEAVAGV